MKKLLLLAVMWISVAAFAQGPPFVFQVQNAGTPIGSQAGSSRLNFASGCTATFTNGVFNINCTGTAGAGTPMGAIDGSKGYVSGDPCVTIAANLATAIATNPQSVDLYLGNFAILFANGIVPCNSNPFENKVFSGHIYLGPIQIVKSVPWITPGNNQRVGIYGDGTSDPGIAIASTASTLTDCDADAPGWNGSTACVVGGVTVPAFPSTGHCITFTYPHGSFGAGTYCPTLWLGGMGAAGVNFGGSFGSVIQDFTIQPGKGGGNFGVYSSGIQEQSYCLNVVVRDSNNSGFFFDKVQGNGSGPGHFKMTSCTARAGLDATQAAAQGYPNVANQIGMGYGIWFEGNGIQVYFTGGTCTTYPQGYPTAITPNGPITAIKMTYAGTCSNVTGLTCNIGTQHGGNGETCGVTTVGNTVTAITVGGVGTNYNLGDTQTGGAFEIEDATINGKNTQNMQEAIVMEGIFSPTVRSIHTGFDAGWGVHVGYGGGTVVGGVFENMDLENTSNGVLHFGVGIDNNQIVLGTGRGGSVASIQDDQNNFTSGTNIPCSIYEPGTISTCIAGGVTVLSNTDTTHVPLTVNGFTGQSSDLLDLAVIGTGNVATVTPAGLGTFAGGLSVNGGTMTVSAAGAVVDVTEVASTSVTAPLFQGSTLAAGGTYCAGACTASLGGGAGAGLFKGGDNSNVGATVTAVSGIFRAGMLTNATPNAAALEGIAQLGSGFLKGSAIASFGDTVSATTTAYTVTDVSHTAPLPIVGCANSTTNPIGVVGVGQAICKIDAAVAALGDIICWGTTTDGVAHDNGTTMCLKPGSLIGVVIADAGTLNGMTGATSGGTAMSTTLVLVQLMLGGGGPQTITLSSQYTNSTTGFTNVTGGANFAFAAAANATYSMSCHLYYQAAATGGLNIEFTGPASPTAVAYGLDDPSAATTFNSSVATAYSTSLGQVVGTATTNFDATVSFSLINGSTGGTVQMLAKSSAVAQLQIQTNSYCMVTQQ